MDALPKKSVIIAVLAIAALTISVVPSFAAPASQHYQVATDQKHISSGDSVTVTATIKRATPACDYAVQLTVTGPGGVSATDTLTVSTHDGGNGHASASFPGDFAGVANTDSTGTYHVSATFTCGYATGAASTTFTVNGASHHEGGDQGDHPEHQHHPGHGE